MSFAIMSEKTFRAHAVDAKRAVRLQAAILHLAGELDQLGEIRAPDLYAMNYDALKDLRNQIGEVLLKRSREQSAPKLKVLQGGAA